MKGLFVVVALFLAGCASKPQQHVDAPADPSLIVLQTEDIGWYMDGDELMTTFHQIRDAQGKILSKRSFFSGAKDPFTGPAGIYLVLLKCANTNGASAGVYNFHKLKIEAEAGKSYVLYCLAMTKKGKFGLNAISGMVPFISETQNYEAERAENVEKLKQVSEEMQANQ